MVRYVRMAGGLLGFALLSVVFGVLVVPAVLVAIFGAMMQGAGERITKGVACLLDAFITAFDRMNKMVNNEGDDC